ncbi:MAG TPA: NifB/NifX family molybdenum-iron cluster-binding protein [Negativicutes bacterium]
MSRVAIASTDGVEINEHFGRAKQFLIYEIDEAGAYKFLERRENIFDDANDRHVATARLLADVEVVLVNKIGPVAEQELQRQGVMALTVSGSIEKALTAYAKRGKFIRNYVQRSVKGCQPVGSCGGCAGSQGCK